MEQELQLWDDTRSQVIQFYIAKLFRRGNQNKTKLLYHFRIGQIDPETNSLKSVIEILNRESHLEDWDSFARKLRDIVIGRCENACFAPREKDIALKMDRILATPQIETTLNIDGVAYLLRTPEITGHIDLSIRFWTTADLLRKFQLKLQQILQNREFRSNVELLPELTVKSMYAEDEEAAEESDEDEESEQEPSIDPEVVKKAKPDTEMLIKVEESIDEDDSVEVEDWEEEDVDEFGGDDIDEEKQAKSLVIAKNNDDKEVVKIQTDRVHVDAEIKDKKIIIIETKSDSTPEIKSSDKTSVDSTLFDADTVKSQDDKLPAKTKELKKEEVSDIDTIENDEKNMLKRRPRTPKNPIEDNKSDEKSDGEKKDDESKKAPKKSVRAKKATSEKKVGEKKVSAKKTPAKKSAAKKPATKKPRKSKKDDEEKKPEADDDK